MSAPQQPSRRENEPVENIAPQEQLDPVSGPDGDSGDQDIDTAGTEADTDSPCAGAAARKRGSGTAPDGEDSVGRPVIDRHR